MKVMTRWKAVILGALTLGIAGWAQRAEAVKNPDTMIVSVTPNVTYGVAITSPSTGGYDFGTVNLNSTTQSTQAIVVQNTGDTAEFFSLAVNAVSGPWLPGATKSADQFVLSGYFNGNGTMPLYTLITSTIATTAPSYSSPTWNQAGIRTGAAANQNLWLRLDMPTTSSVSGAQQLLLSINGQGN